MEEDLVAAQAAMERSQACQALCYNHTRRPVRYQAGDSVYVAVQGLPKSKRGNKIDSRLREPCTVAQRMGIMDTLYEQLVCRPLWQSLADPHGSAVRAHSAQRGTPRLRYVNQQPACTRY